jgi:hypothetical protein
MDGLKHFVCFLGREGPSNVCPRISALAPPLPVPPGNRDVDLFFWSKMEPPPKSGAQLLAFTFRTVARLGIVAHLHLYSNSACGESRLGSRPCPSGRTELLMSSVFTVISPGFAFLLVQQLLGVFLEVLE